MDFQAQNTKVFSLSMKLKRLLEKTTQTIIKSKPKNPVISNHSLSSTTASQQTQHVAETQESQNINESISPPATSYSNRNFLCEPIISENSSLSFMDSRISTKSVQTKPFTVTLSTLLVELNRGNVKQNYLRHQRLQKFFVISREQRIGSTPTDTKLKFSNDTPKTDEKSQPILGENKISFEQRFYFKCKTR